MDAEITQLKRLTIQALVSDDELVQRLVLKGGNALSLAYGHTARASFDLDFSMTDAFDDERLPDIRQRIQTQLERAFETAGYVVFDVELEPRPENLSADLASFWGGYSLEFKVIPRKRYDELNGNLFELRRQAMPARPGGKARWEIDISRYEYCEGKTRTEIDQFTVFVYTPAMIVCEKIRALCQQTEEYAKFVRSHRTPRARDFFDIVEATNRFGIDVTAAENLELLQNIFAAKHVPLHLLHAIDGDREFHRLAWQNVVDTVATDVRLRRYEYYSDRVVALCAELAQRLGVNPLGT
ncbi:MAG: nucleotidyl transferase AbiEii/AbiGii toxin family protein [Phycisphaerae bacterium]